MNEKTKRIISYIGCAFGGMALGIALLGGLSYCSTAKKQPNESVNTILTKKNTVITTDGGYTGYQFTLDVDMPVVEKAYQYSIYSFDVSTYTPTLIASQSGTFSTNTRSALVNLKNSAYSEGRALANNDDYRNTRLFLLLSAYAYPFGGNEATRYYPILYLTFIEPSFTTYLSNVTNVQTAFVTDDLGYYWNAIGWDTNSYAQQGVLQGTQYFVSNQKVDSYLYWTQDSGTPETLTFQDVASYYKETGYQDGYDDGETTGYNSGYEVGYSDGSETGRMFTALGLNQTTWYKSDLTPTSTSETSNFYKLLEFKDGDNEEWGVAAELFTTNDLFKVDLYKNINQGYTSATYYGTLGEGTMTYVSGVWQVEMTPATYYFYEWAQITEVYNNSLPLNYFLLTGTPQNATGYQQGYQAGYQAGILATPGGEATNNVFSLFTNAFDSVGGFFNLKIFGFLPLYWFFLAPLFVALITLLLRMVKH